MTNDIQTILFTSNLSATSRSTFTHAALLASRCNARIVLLHVLEKVTSSYETRMFDLFGTMKWHDVVKQHKEHARHALIGKITPTQMARTALSEFCREAATGENESGALQHEVVVSQGDVVEEILRQVEEHDCDLIVMGGCRGLLAGSSVSHNIKSVLKKSPVPTLVVPAASGGSDA